MRDTRRPLPKKVHVLGGVMNGMGLGLGIATVGNGSLAGWIPIGLCSLGLALQFASAHFGDLAASEEATNAPHP